MESITGQKDALSRSKGTTAFGARLRIAKSCDVPRAENERKEMELEV
jgi:hypothetical protein